MILSFTECLYANEDKKYPFLAENQLTLKASNNGKELWYSINTSVWHAGVNLWTEGAEIKDFASVFTEKINCGFFFSRTVGASELCFSPLIKLKEEEEKVGSTGVEETTAVV